MDQEIFERDLASDSRIDRYALERAAEEQANIYSFWAKEAAEAKRVEEGIENKLRLAKADEAVTIRASGEKVTEAGIVEKITRAPAIRAVEDELLEARKKRNLAEAAVRAMDHRKSMIETLSRLWVAGYYGDPTKNRGTELTQRNRARLNNREDED